MKVFLDAPRSFANVCMVARTLEVFGLGCCYVNDVHGLIRSRYGKSRMRLARSASAGAFPLVRFEPVSDVAGFFSEQPARLVGTVAKGPATPLQEFSFQKDDVLVFGSERTGVSPGLLSMADERLTIPLVGRTQGLNLAVAVGIVLFEIKRQIPY